MISMREIHKRSLVVSMIVLLSTIVAAQSAPEVPDRNVGTKNPLVGAWKLFSLEEPGADEKLQKADCAGMLVLTVDGKASVQVMYRNAQSDSAYAQGGYEASYGTYQIDNSSTLTFHIDGSLVPALRGKYLKRTYQISGSRLTIQSTERNEKWKVVWERF
jgi:hypothetical protein